MSNSNETFSVVVPSARGGNDLQRALNSVLHSEYVGEVIVVFNGADAFSNLQDFHEKFLNQDDKVKVLCDSTISNAPAARNLGLAQCNYDYVHFLDDDDYVSADFYSKAHYVLSKNNENIVGVAFSANIISDCDDKLVGLAIRKKLFVSQEDLLLDNFIGVTSGVIVSRAAAANVGGFNEAMPARQDYMFWLEISSLGKFYCSKDAELFWTQHVKQKSLSNSGGLEKHKLAIKLLNEYKLQQLKRIRVSKLGMSRKISSNHFKYLASISERSGLIAKYKYICLSFLAWPNIAALSMLLPKKLLLALKKRFF